MSICPSRSPLTCPAQKVSGSEPRDNHLQVAKLTGSDQLNDFSRLRMMQAGKRFEDGHFVSGCGRL